MRINPNRFVGRQQELALLNSFVDKGRASLLVVKGRRRVGKSRLAEEFAKDKLFYKFSGLAPVEGVTAQAQRDEFSRQLAEQLDVPRISTDDWAELFSLLGKLAAHGQIIILFDEISWMAHGDDTFLSKLKNAWEESFKKNPDLILILCGSVSTWIEENIISSTGYFGRISWILHLEPLPLKDCYAMLKTQGFNTTEHEIFKILCVTGGIPWYIEQMKYKKTADENIQHQCFTKGAVLTEDFDLIFHELFVRRDEIYKKIVIALSGAPLDYNAIAQATRYPKSGRLSGYIEDLIKAGFVAKDQTWSLKTLKPLDLYTYRLSDNYLRFYIKYILPRKHHIKMQRMASVHLSSLPGWESILGLQFENLVINNRHELYEVLNIKMQDIVYDNPYFQRQTERQQGVQLDFVIQTRHNTVYIIEIKFSKNKLGRKVIEEVKNKIDKIKLPKNMVCLPVLIHVNGISKQIEAEGFFYEVIRFGQFLHN